MTSYATPRSPLRHITTPPLTSPTSARRHTEEVEELRTLQKKNSELRRALEQRKAYPWPSSEARQRATEFAAAAAPRPTPPPQRPVSAAHISGRSDAPVSRSHYSPQPPPRQSLGRRNLDFDEDSATEARKLVESAAATVSAERQEARVAEATQRALTRLNELESAAAAAERRVRGAEEREATLRRVVDAAKADVRSRARPEPCVGWLATLAMLFLAFGAGMMVQTPYPTYAVTH